MDGSEFKSNPAFELRELYLFAAHRAHWGSADTGKALQLSRECLITEAKLQTSRWSTGIEKFLMCQPVGQMLLFLC